MSRVFPICSSSKGNCTYIGTTESGVLIDCGCSLKALRCGLSLLGLDLTAVKAVLVTHEHIDHIRGLYQLTKQTRIPIYASAGTLDYMTANNCVESAAALYDVTELQNAPTDYELRFFRTPHDSAESVGYTLTEDDYKIAFCTDLGHVTEEVRSNVVGSNFAFIEANYEPAILKTNPHYPEYLKRRIASDHGHLSNPDSAEFAAELIKSGTTRLVLGHLSQENNYPKLAFDRVSERLAADGMEIDRDFTLTVAPVKTEGEFVAI